MTANAREKAAVAVKALDKHLAKNIRVIDVEEITSLCDCFVIAHGNSSTQVKALADYVEKALHDVGIEPLRTEGYQSSGWVLIDYADVIVHVFHEEMRGFYDLEHLWKDGVDVDIAQFIENEETT